MISYLLARIVFIHNTRKSWLQGTPSQRTSVTQNPLYNLFYSESRLLMAYFFWTFAGMHDLTLCLVKDWLVLGIVFLLFPASPFFFQIWSFPGLIVYSPVPIILKNWIIFPTLVVNQNHHTSQGTTSLFFFVTRFLIFYCWSGFWFYFLIHLIVWSEWLE